METQAGNVCPSCGHGNRPDRRFCTECGSRRTRARAACGAPLVHVERAELARQNGDEKGRARALREAQRLFTEIGATARAAAVERERRA